MKKILFTLGIAATLASAGASTTGDAAVLVQEVYKEQCTSINQNTEGEKQWKDILEDWGVQVEILYQGSCPVIPGGGDTQPDISVPDTSEPETSPETSEPECSVPEQEMPESSLPETEAPDVSEPEVEVPETSEPEIEVPETSEPETEVPETFEPETEAPETSEPEAEAPEGSHPETEVPESSVPETEKPEVPDTQPPVNSPEENVHPYVLRILELVNEERAAAGLKPVVLDAAASLAARIRARETVTSFSHTRPDGRSFTTALTEQGVSYRMAGENIAWGQKSPEQVMAGWMNSAGHRANILKESFTHIGIGYHQENGINYWTQLFYR